MQAGTLQIISLVLIFVIFYGFLLIPERKKRKNYSNMLASIKEGDKVMTRGGIIGRIVKMDEETVVIETEPDKVKLTFSKQGILNLLIEDIEK